jgi:outer membrane receptor protein involved in Fe transport
VAEFTNQTTINGQTAQVSGVGNGEGGYIRGLEVALLMNFDDLPAPFNGLGLSANYAYTETNVDPSGDNTFGLTGLSKDVGNAALWWAGEKIEARVGVDYRSEYTDIDDFGNFLTIKDVTTVSTNFAYNFNKDLRVNFFVSNLTDEERSKYTGGVPQRTSFTSSYGRILGLGVHYTM